MDNLILTGFATSFGISLDYLYTLKWVQINHLLEKYLLFNLLIVNECTIVLQINETKKFYIS